MSPKDFIMALALFGEKFPDRENIIEIRGVAGIVTITCVDEDGSYDSTVNLKTKTVN